MTHIAFASMAKFWPANHRNSFGETAARPDWRVQDEKKGGDMILNGERKKKNEASKWEEKCVTHIWYYRDGAYE